MPGGRAATFGLYGRIGLSVALSAAMMFWPYDAKCGAGLALYLGAVASVLVSGIWSAVWSWRHRASRLHVLSLLLVTWGLILGSLEVLPRIGYAKPDPLIPRPGPASSFDVAGRFLIRARPAVVFTFPV